MLALSIAVIIFAFQAVPPFGNRPRLYEFAEDAFLFPVFYSGLVGLIVNGLVLLGVGNSAPAGGAASWAVLVSESALPLLAVLFAYTVRALDPQVLHLRRLARVRTAVKRAAESEVFERIAFNLLKARCHSFGVLLAQSA